MNTFSSMLGLALVLPLAVGCASRAAPFDNLDKAQVTIFRLQGQEPPPAAAPAPVTPGAGLIPGVPAELQQMGQQLAQGLQQMLPPGTLPPGLIPGQPATTPVVPQQPQLPRFKGYIILGQQPLMDADTKDELLDVFGGEDNFGSNRGNCFYPEMGVAFVRQDGPPIELLVSMQCNQAQIDGAQWPHKTGNAFTPESSQRMSKLYGQLWGGAPMSGGM